MYLKAAPVKRSAFLPRESGRASPLSCGAAWSSATDNIYKMYAESFKDEAHLYAIPADAEGIVNYALHASKG
jgi:hypothetical protein